MIKTVLLVMFICQENDCSYWEVPMKDMDACVVSIAYVEFNQIEGVKEIYCEDTGIRI